MLQHPLYEELILSPLLDEMFYLKMTVVILPLREFISLILQKDRMGRIVIQSDYGP